MRAFQPFLFVVCFGVIAIGCSGDPIGVESLDDQPAFASEASPVTEIPPFPFWARGPLCCFNGYSVVYFYNTDPADVPGDFNFLNFFDFRALGADWAVEGHGVFDVPGAPPKTSHLTGLGAVPFWFFTEDDFAAFTADGIVTRPELESFNPISGFATHFNEVLHPTGSTASQIHLNTSASGDLVDGGTFKFNVNFHTNPTTGVTSIHGNVKLKGN